MATLLTTATLKNLIRIKDVSIDNGVFRLHYKVTTAVLVAFSILVTGTQFFGEPIKCIQKDDIPTKLLDTFCWIESTYSVTKAFDLEVGKQVAYPGVIKTEEGDELIEHAYYQWVCFVLFLQGIMFYIPRIIWKAIEGGRINNIIFNLNNPIICEEERDTKCEKLSLYFKTTLRKNYWYATTFVLCEVLNFINVVGQIYIIDRFLGGSFTTYGTDVINFSETDQNNRVDPMIRVFPRMTKCRFHRYGSSGDVQTHDAFCLLPLNIVNEKIYIILWFWFVILAVLSGLALVWRAVMLSMPKMRYAATNTFNSFTNSRHIKIILRRASYADWFLLSLLNKNIYNLHFKHLLEHLSKNIDTSYSNDTKPKYNSEKEILTSEA